jgi:small nuclear ribonucleoprotein (snRNP)-like protein
VAFPAGAEKVLIVTADSRILVGTLAACDNSTNLVSSYTQLYIRETAAVRETASLGARCEAVAEMLHASTAEQGC